VELLKSEYYELPNRYNQTVIRLLVQSPTRLFAYWEVSDDTIRSFNAHHQKYDDCMAVLKVTNISKNYSYNIPVSPFANNYYIEVEDSGCQYVVELGRYSNKDGYINLYTSNVAMVPSGSPAHTNYTSFTDGILFANYLCISDKRRIKIFGSKDQYGRFANQNHTAFERKRFGGTSEEYLAGSSEQYLGSSDNYLGSSDNYMGSSDNYMIH